MRVPAGKISLLLTLGLVVAGCNQAGDHSATISSAQAPGEYVLTVEGMVRLP